MATVAVLLTRPVVVSVAVNSKLSLPVKPAIGRVGQIGARAAELAIRGRAVTV